MGEGWGEGGEVRVRACACSSLRRCTALSAPPPTTRKAWLGLRLGFGLGLGLGQGLGLGFGLGID